MFGQQGPTSFALGTHADVEGSNVDPASNVAGFAPDDIQADVRRLKSRGVEFTDAHAKFDEVTVATFKDPERNRIELLRCA